MEKPGDHRTPYYSHTQIGYWLRFGMWLGALVYPAILLIKPETETEIQLVTYLIGGFTGLFLFVGGWIFGSLTVNVTANQVQWHFGPGFWKKSIARDQITSTTAIRTKWWYGFGIRLSPHGWLYNVQGLDAVLITEISGKTTLIGTDEPVVLVQALHENN